MDKRGSPTRRQPHQNILPTQPPLQNRTATRLRIVFRPLLRPKNRLWPTRQNRLHLLGRSMKSRRHLARIQHAQPSTRSCPNIKKPPPTLQRFGHDSRRLPNFSAGAT